MAESERDRIAQQTADLRVTFDMALSNKRKYPVTEFKAFVQAPRKWKATQNVTLRQEHRAGERMFVDWAGTTVPLYDAGTGELIERASVFVATLGASSYTFALATLRQDLHSWIDCHVRAFEFFTGCPTLVIPDNPRTAVNRACRYEPDLNRTYLETAQHYGVAALPPRPRKPRDKAEVESAVGVVQRWILAALRHRKFFSLGELNGAIAELLQHLNQRPFRKREGTLASLFAALDQPALKPRRWNANGGRVEKLSRQHRLSGGSGPSLLQRVLPVCGAAVGDASHALDSGDFSSRCSHCLTGAECIALPAFHTAGSPAQESPGRSGLDSLHA